MKRRNAYKWCEIPVHAYIVDGRDWACMNRASRISFTEYIMTSSFKENIAAYTEKVQKKKSNMKFNYKSFSEFFCKWQGIAEGTGNRDYMMHMLMHWKYDKILKEILILFMAFRKGNTHQSFVWLSSGFQSLKFFCFSDYHNHSDQNQVSVWVFV